MGKEVNLKIKVSFSASSSFFALALLLAFFVKMGQGESIKDADCRVQDRNKMHEGCRLQGAGQEENA